MTVDNIAFTLFRHKWRILLCAAAGVAGAVGLYYGNRPLYQSEAVLFIRYVVDNGTPDAPDSDAKASLPDSRGENIMATEVAILRSLDIDYQVVDAVGAERILSRTKGAKDRDRAAFAVQQNLTVEPLPESSVIRLIFKSRDPAMVQPILGAVIDAYLKKHVVVHGGTGAVGDFLFQETDQLHSRLTQTEDALRQADHQAGIISLDDFKRASADQLAQIESEILSAKAELAERSAILQAMTATAPPTLAGTKTAPEPDAPPAVAGEYRGVRLRLDALTTTEQQLLTQFTDKNARVQEVRAQIAETEGRRAALEKRYPSLARLSSASLLAPAGGFDLVTPTAQLAGLQSKIAVLTAELAQIRTDAGHVDRVAGAIAELQRQKELDEANYRYYSAHLEGARIDEAIGAGRALNIAVIQAPSPAYADWLGTYKSMAAAVAAGLGLGLAWALLLEMYLDHSIRRPIDVERWLQIPLFLSMPDFGRNGHDSHLFHDTLRDRLIGYFENRNLIHKPKLLAITGVGRNSGVTSTAAGLARSLSETGDGKVLLVDMTAGRGSAQQFRHGKADCGLDELLDARQGAQAEENLYVVVERPEGDKLTRALPSRFQRLLPKLKASDFDYIIFDMPSVNQISITPRLAGLMDLVLLVVESGRTHRDIARQAVMLLTESGAEVGAILNKTRNYLPSRQQHDFLGRL